MRPTAALGVMAISAIVISASLTAGASAAGSQADMSVTYGINVAHTSSPSGDSLTAPLLKRWSRTDLGGQPQYPLIANGLVYAAANGTIYALNEKSGTTVWIQSIGGTYHSAQIGYDNGILFAVNHDGLLSAYNASTGVLQWSAQMAGQYSFTSPPTAANGTVYISGAGSGGTLYAVNESNGVTLWTQSVMNGDNSSPALDGSNVYVSYACPQTYSFNALMGTSVWHYSGPCEGGGGNTPVYFNGSLYVVDNISSPTGYQFNTSNGAVQSRFSASSLPSFSGSYEAVVTGASYYNGGTLTLWNLPTAAALWTYAGDGKVFSNPVIVNNTIYVASTSGNVYGVDVNGPSAGVWTGAAGAPISYPLNGQNYGMAAGEGLLVVPHSTGLAAFSTQSAPAVTGTTISATEGKAFSGLVASFTDSTGLNSSFTATIDWGDGTSSAGTVVANNTGGYTVTGSHTYAEEGSRTATTSVTDNDGTSSASDAVTVADAPLTAIGSNVTATAGTLFSGTVASFTDSNPGCPTSDFSATIAWGDGTTSTATIAAGAAACSFTVSGSHTYAGQGTYAVKTTIKDIGGATVTGSSTATVAKKKGPGH